MSSQTAVGVVKATEATPYAPWRVRCLCAAWCGVCRQYEAEFRALAQQFPAMDFAWVDVEDSEELVGDLDVETFPTVLIGRGEQAYFLGPLLPQIQVLERLLESLQDGAPPAASLPAEAQPLWQRVVSQST